MLEIVLTNHDGILVQREDDDEDDEDSDDDEVFNRFPPSPFPDRAEIVLTNGDDVQVRQEARFWISGRFASRPELQSLLAQQTNGQHSVWTSADNKLLKQILSR